ncbi:MAG: DUF3604 domain-containing protein, partial [Promethearchaeota archaeon]
MLKLRNLKINPSEIKVRTFSTIEISFKIDFDIPKYSFLIFRFRGGRNNKNDWYYIQTEDPNYYGFSVLKAKGDPYLIPLTITGKELAIKYLVCEDNGIHKNTEFNFKIFNTLSQSLVEYNKKIEIIIKFPEEELKVFQNSPSINIVNDNFDHISIICPSIVSLSEEFNILLRFEDQFKNLVRNFSKNIEIFKLDTNGNIIESKDIILQDMETGIIKIKDFNFSDLGVFYIGIKYQEHIFFSNPILCNKSSSKLRLYWGYIHGHTNKSDGVRELKEYFTNLKNSGLDYGTSTEHDHSWETTNEDFNEIKDLVKQFNKENEFISFFGYEYGTWYTGEGDICIYYKNDKYPILRSEVNKYNSVEKLIKNLAPYKEEVLMISHHTALRPGYRNWKPFDNTLEKLVEIYSTWGNQEYPFSEGNPLPPRYKFFGYGKYAKKRGPILEKKGCFVLDALMKGYKLGFTAGGDDHFGIYPGGSIDPDNGIYPPGIMAIWAENLTTSALWDALNNRRCYGTTGPRVIIKFYLNNYFMGEIIDLKFNPELNFKRKIKLQIYSPLKIIKIELIRNNSVFKKKQ